MIDAKSLYDLVTKESAVHSARYKCTVRAGKCFDRPSDTQEPFSDGCHQNDSQPTG